MELSFLKPLYSRPGPYASVYADLTRTTEDAGKAVELRWRALHAELEAQGAPKPTLRAVERAVEEEVERRRSEGLVIFAADGEVVFSERFEHAPRTPLARVSPLPHVMPYLSDRGERFAHLVAHVDRRGGEIDCVDPEGRHRHIDVPGDEEYPIRKVKAGDWNQSRFQRSAENVWKSNAKKVAREIDKVARASHAEAVVIAGDARARTAVLEEISDGVLEHTVESDRGNGLDGELSRILDLKSTERILTVAERFERELANGERAVAGLPATVEAVRRGQVETLLIDDDPASPARLWTGPQPFEVATTPDDLRPLGVDDPVEERADAALIRAVAATDGDVVVLPSDGPNASLGVGAVLRYNDPSTRH
ncbi:Vms1/Ankzf1 family peptidyl-tRNA hydrolase [Actinomadura rugatobispora]|uniref:Vms1/Ankzf1 family peptidyl-tRNA hydrolase n=1 Tax=Actinomadura rugatobispora TaxID=1994 RepID=A0ABW1AGU8_9ACTN|nr:Vms1/Ankzf1 family peptidyl-tRNA hydrolase [Actinomadura rugatobispora]